MGIYFYRIKSRLFTKDRSEIINDLYYSYHNMTNTKWSIRSVN